MQTVSTKQFNLTSSKSFIFVSCIAYSNVCETCVYSLLKRVFAYFISIAYLMFFNSRRWRNIVRAVIYINLKIIWCLPFLLCKN